MDNSEDEDNDGDWGDFEEDDGEIFDDFKPTEKSIEQIQLECDFEEKKKDISVVGSPQAINRLLKDLKHTMSKEFRDQCFEASLIDNDLFHWEIKMRGFPDDGTCPLYDDLKKSPTRHDYVLLHCRFSNDHPHKPPFIRVVEPRFVFHTGHITIGGSLCMEILTTSGWSCAIDLESILVSVRAEMVAGNARIDFKFGLFYPPNF